MWFVLMMLVIFFSKILMICQVISTANIMTSFDCLSMAVSHQKQITSSLATTWIEESSRSRRYVFCLHTRSNILKISSSSGATMSARVSIVSTDFTMSV